MNPVFRLASFAKPYWKRAVIALICLGALVLLDLAIPRLIQRIIDQGIAKSDQAVVLQTAAIMIGISLLSAVISVCNNLYSIQVGEGVARDVREALFLKIQNFSFTNLDQQRTGQLIVRLTSDVTALKNLYQVTLRIGTRGPLVMIGSVILMVSTSPSLALTLSPLLLVTAVLIVFFIVRMEPLYRSVQERLDRLNGVLQENIAGARLVKAFVRADFEAQRFEGSNEALTRQSIKVMQFMSSMGPILTMCVNIGIVIVIWAGGLRTIAGEMSLGQIVAFTNYLLTAMTPLIMLTMLSQTWAAGGASAKRIQEVLDTVSEIQDAPDAVTLPAQSPGRVVFEDVSFRYAGTGDEDVLEHVNLVAEPGQTIAILGATGAGKSSLVNLIPRFYDVTSGRILFDDVDIRQATQDSLLAHIGIVPQEAILFSGTVRDNIRYGNPNASDEDVLAAAKAAQAHEFIMKLAEQYDTHIEQRGVNLSGGQKQRMAIARALLMRPKVLIFDDSTSAVDVETETKIQDALEEQMAHSGLGASTNLVVAQRISTVLKADKIVVIDKGRIVAEGTHQQLLQTSPIYREIYESQLGGGVREDRRREEAAQLHSNGHTHGQGVAEPSNGHVPTPALSGQKEAAE